MCVYGYAINKKNTKQNGSQAVLSESRRHNKESGASYESTAPAAPATETLLPKRDFFDRGAEAEVSSMVRLRFVALRAPIFFLLVSITSSSSSSFLLGLYAAASGGRVLRLLRVAGRVCSFSAGTSCSSVVVGASSKVPSAEAFSSGTSSAKRLCRLAWCSSSSSSSSSLRSLRSLSLFLRVRPAGRLSGTAPS